MSMLSGEPVTSPAAPDLPPPPDEGRTDILKQIVLSNELPEDESLFEKVLYLITDMGYASTMVLQHKLEMSYRQAADIIAEMERSGLIGPAHGFRPHKILPCAYAIRDRLEAASGKYIWQDDNDQESERDALCER